MFIILVFYAITETISYLKYSNKLNELKTEEKNYRRESKEWRNNNKHLIPNKIKHKSMEKLIKKYEQGDSVFKPNYKPVILYSAMKCFYHVCSLIWYAFGWRRLLYGDIYYWVKGKGEPVLFLHGFGFGVFPYLSVLNRLSNKYTIIAPEYPKVSFNQNHHHMTIPNYSSKLIKLMYDYDAYSVLSNSFGTVIHSYLLIHDHNKIKKNIFVEPVCFFPYFPKLTNFVNIDLNVIWNMKGLRNKLALLVTYIFISKDIDVLYQCEQFIYSLFWDCEKYLHKCDSCIIFSENDYIIESHDLNEYFIKTHPNVNTHIVKNSRHSEAIFDYDLNLFL